MSKRRKSKPKRVTLKDRSGLSAKSYRNLERQAENARRRIKAFSKREDALNYFVPDIDDYKMEALVRRLEAGEANRSILRELRNITAEKIMSGTPLHVLMKDGNKLPYQDAVRLNKAITDANRNIVAARAKYPDFVDILPDKFSPREIMSNMVDAGSVATKINDLSLFTPDNLIPIAVNDEGLAGTYAEYHYYRNVLERENERRQHKREQNDPTTQSGFFLQQNNYESRDIDIDNIASIDELKQRAITWDDPARVYRANLFLSNYEKSLDMFAAALINSGYWNDVVEERVEYIRNIIARLYFNEEAISYLSMRVPNIDISLLYAGANGDVDFDSIYNAWTYIEDEWL